MVRKQITKKVKGAERTKRVSKTATAMQARKPTVDLAALESEERRICSAPSGNGEEARRRVWRVVGVRVGLPRHDTEVSTVNQNTRNVKISKWRENSLN